MVTDVGSEAVMRWWVIFAGALAACNGPDKDGDKDGPTGDDDDDTDTDTPVVWDCVLDPTLLGCDATDASGQVGCVTDFDALASLPLDASIPGARSIKTILDQLDGDAFYFMNSVKYPIHHAYAYNFLGAAQGKPPVGDLAAFNQTEYYSPDRRFILGAVTFYEGADRYVYEIAPYDTADAEMVAKAVRAIQANAFFGQELAFHPSSASQDALLPLLPADIPVITSDELYAGITYQPYNLGRTTGLLTFHTVEEVDGEYTPFRELVVLDKIPNDISIVAGIITSEFQTPLAHINVLSINRGTPNMGLAGGFDDPTLRALEGKWVELEVDAFEWTIREITEQEAEEQWELLKPQPITVPEIDASVSEMRSAADIVDKAAIEAGTTTLREEITRNVRIFGSKGTNYASLYDIPDENGVDIVPIQNAFVIPFYWYQDHMNTPRTSLGGGTLQDELIAMHDEANWDDPAYRDQRLIQFKNLIVAEPLSSVFLTTLYDKINSMDNFIPGQKVRFRSSTNAEDLGNFTGAGIYDSQSGDPTIPGTGEDTIEWAVKTAWSNLWNTRAYEERSLYSIDQFSVGMALLTTPNFEEEEANGVAISNNIFDTSMLEPAFYVNVQIDNNEVVQPEPGVVPDAFIHYFYTPGEPIVYTQHCSLIPDGDTVLTNQQIHDLGVALDAIQRHFRPVYEEPGKWYGMDTEFKFDDKLDPGNPPTLFMKQARPFPWTPGSSPLSLCEQ